MKRVGFVTFDAVGWIVLAPTVGSRKADQDPDLFQQVISRSRCGLPLCQHLVDVLPRHLPDQSVADIFIADPPLDHELVGTLRRLRKPGEAGALEIFLDQSIEGTWFSAPSLLCRH